MVISKGGSSRILILFRSMKSTGEFPALRRKGVFGSLPSVFDNLLCSFTLILLILRDFRDRGGGLINVIC